MTAEEITALLQKEFGPDLLESKMDAKDPWVRVNPSKIADVGRFLRDHPAIRLDYPRSVGALDWPEGFELVYHLFSMAHRHSFVVKTRVPRENPKLPTVETVWPGANWHEREAYDLMGIIFEGHSDLRRLLLPDDWEGHPLRKDYQEKDQYHGISTTREYSTGMPELPTLKK
jgi:NADH-quinone oxidoreductase subunit C